MSNAGIATHSHFSTDKKSFDSRGANSWSSNLDDNESSWTINRNSESLYDCEENDGGGIRKRGLLYLPTGEVKHVQLFIEPQTDALRPGMSLCERLLGIVPGRFAIDDAITASGAERPLAKNLVLVEALIPGRQAYRSGLVCIHDWLVCINDLEVRWETVETILAAVASPKKVKLTLHKMAVDAQQRVVTVMARTGLAGGQSLITALGGADTTANAEVSTSSHYTVMYLTLDTSSDMASPTDDLLYCFPRPDCELITLRGLFLTLSNVMADLSGHRARVSSVLHGSELVHIGYSSQGRELLVVTAPAKSVTSDCLVSILDGVARVLSFSYDSLHRAFSVAANKHRLDMFFTLLARRLSGNTGVPPSGAECTLDSFPAAAARWLPVPEDAKLKFDDILNGLESADFGDMADDYYGLRRMYTVLGSCVYYKGHVIASHLPTDDLADITAYAKFYGLLEVSRSRIFENVVIWKEVFPTRRRHDCATWHPSMGYSEPVGRWFMLIIALGHGALAALLEAGGCATKMTGYPAPDPFYVNQAQQTLLELEAAANFSSVCESRLQSPIPELTTVEAFVPSRQFSNIALSPRAIFSKRFASGRETKRKTSSAQQMTPPPPSSIRRSSDQILPPPLGADSAQSDGGRGIGLDSGESMTSHSSSSPPLTPLLLGEGSMSNASSASNLYKVPSRQRRVLGTASVSLDSPGDKGPGDKRQTNIAQAGGAGGTEENEFTRLTSGDCNTLFSYISYEVNQGVILMPASAESVGGAITRELLDNFVWSCATIRALLRRDDCVGSRMSGGKAAIGANERVVREHGMLFRCQPSTGLSAGSGSRKKLQPHQTDVVSHVSYWVVGRLMKVPIEREFYVCFHESVQETAVELAFKISHGLLL